MQSVEKVLLLQNGPPWGFRLQETYSGVIVISQIRRNSPADLAGMRDEDQIVAIDKFSTLGMDRNQVTQFINNFDYELQIIVRRMEKRKPNVLTFFLDTGAARGRRIEQGYSTKEVLLQRPKSPSPEPVPDDVYHPYDPDITPMSIEKLLREFEPPPRVKPPERRHDFGNSAFYAGGDIYYPSIEEQRELARRVAESIRAPVNSESRGANMFDVQRKRADKHVKEGPEPAFDPIANATPAELEYMIPPMPPPRVPYQANSFPNMRPIGPPPPLPPLRPGQPKSVQEFLDKINLFPKNLHNQIDPQMCFDLAAALYTSDSRGSDMFAKRRARAQNWEVGSEITEKHEQPQMVPKQFIKPKLVSRLVAQPNITGNIAVSDRRDNNNSSSMFPPIDESIDMGTTWKGNYSVENSRRTSQVNLSGPPPSQTWRAVKFNVPQRAI